MKVPIGRQAIGLLAWDGLAPIPRDIRTYRDFAWTIEVTAATVAPAVFTVQWAPPSASDPCVPGTFQDANQLILCDGGDPSLPSQITIPPGPAGRVCQASIPEKPGAFVQLVPSSGPTGSMRAVLVQVAPY